MECDYDQAMMSGMNCIKIGLPGKLILGDYFQEIMTSRRPLLLLRISFPGKLILIQLPPDDHSGDHGGDHERRSNGSGISASNNANHATNSGANSADHDDVNNKVGSL